jgi:hypothetical protein
LCSAARSNRIVRRDKQKDFPLIIKVLAADQMKTTKTPAPVNTTNIQVCARENVTCINGQHPCQAEEFVGRDGMNTLKKVALFTILLLCNISSAQTLYATLGWMQRTLWEGTYYVRDTQHGYGVDRTHTALLSHQKCEVVFQQTSVWEDKPGHVAETYTFRQFFNLRDLTPKADLLPIQDVFGNSLGTSVIFHTPEGKMLVEVDPPALRGTQDLTATFWLDDNYAPRFARALRHAIELCGGNAEPF